MSLWVALLGYVFVLMAIDLSAEGLPADWLRLFLPNIWLIIFVWGFLRDLMPSINIHGERSVLPGLIAVGGLITLFALAASGKNTNNGMQTLDVVRMLVLIVLIPIAEEAYFRGVLFSHLCQQTGSVLAVFLVSLLFGFMHYPTGLFLPMAGLSFIMCLLVLLSKTIVWSIMLHALWNAIAVMKTLPTQEWRFSLAFGVSLITIIIIGLALRTRPGKTE